jgi:hypothetical protein
MRVAEDHVDAEAGNLVDAEIGGVGRRIEAQRAVYVETSDVQDLQISGAERIVVATEECLARQGRGVVDDPLLRFSRHSRNSWTSACALANEIPSIIRASQSAMYKPPQ